MFGFGRAKTEKKPKEPRRQGFMTEDEKWVTFGPDDPFRYEGRRNSLVREGTVWPPVLRDDSSYDRTELFQSIAESLNNLGTNRAVIKKLRELAADYKANKISATDVTASVVRIVEVLKERNIQVG